MSSTNPTQIISTIKVQQGVATNIQLLLQEVPLDAEGQIISLNENEGKQRVGELGYIVKTINGKPCNFLYWVSPTSYQWEPLTNFITAQVSNSSCSLSYNNDGYKFETNANLSQGNNYYIQCESNTSFNFPDIDLYIYNYNPTQNYISTKTQLFSEINSSECHTGTRIGEVILKIEEDKLCIIYHRDKKIDSDSGFQTLVKITQF